jgi:predicted extracellular nuclease
VTVSAATAHQGCTALVDGLGPDGNLDVENPQNAQTCDTDGDGVFDGNRLFSRPPLVVEMHADLGGGETLPLWVLVNHWKSKREDTRTQAYTLPRRLEQAAFVAALMREIEAAHPGAAVIVLGDLNDIPASQPLGVLASAGLWNAARSIPRAARYTYIYRGISQTLDHVLVNAPLAINWVDVQPIHLGADYPAIYEDQPGIYRASDHDPLRVTYTVLPWRAYLPLVSR